MEEPITGAEVRFTAGPLGCIDPENPNRFQEETVQLGDTGRIENADYLEGWIAVRPDKYPELIVPVHQAMVEQKVGAAH